MSNNRTLVAGSALVSLWLLGGFALPQTPPSVKATDAGRVLTGTTVATLSDQYSDFAGSPEKAKALVMGLRDGTPVELTVSAGILSAITPSASFTPVTGTLGHGETDIAESLAEAAKLNAHSTSSTPGKSGESQSSKGSGNSQGGGNSGGGNSSGGSKK